MANFNLTMPCPKCMNSRGTFRTEEWFHGGSCNGRLYIDDEAIVHCSRCGKSAHIKQMKLTCESYNHTLFQPTKQEICASFAAGNVGVVNNSMYWYKRIIDNV